MVKISAQNVLRNSSFIVLFRFIYFSAVMFILGQQIVDGEPNGPVGDREEQGDCREHPVVELPLAGNIF